MKRFEPFEDNLADSKMSDQNTSVFVISTFQYISVAVFFSKGKPFRKSIFSNCNLFSVFINSARAKIDLVEIISYVESKKSI